MKKKFFDNLYTFKSIYILLFIYFATIMTIISTFGFSLTSYILFLILLLFFIFYLSATLFSYYYLPKCPKNKIGILILIPTENEKYYNILVEKLIYNFKNLTANQSKINFKAIVLSQKKVNKLKDISDKNYQEQLVDKTLCTLCVIIHPVDNGENSDNYTLELRAGTKIPAMSKELSNAFNKNFYLSFKDLKENEFNIHNDYSNLKNFSYQLFIFCRYLFASTIYFSKEFDLAYTLFSSLYNDVINIKINNSIYNSIKFTGAIWLMELCNISCQKEYEKFIFDGTCDLDKYLLSLKQFENCLTRKPLSQFNSFIIDYHMAKATYYFLKNRNTIQALKEIDFLDKLFPHNMGNCIWDYSKAFLIAYTTNDFWKIKKNYEKLKNNYQVNIIYILSFIDNVLKLENNLGLKVARIYVYYYREDLKDKSLFNEYKKDVLKELKKTNMEDFTNHIKNLKIKKFQNNNLN